MVTSGRAGDPDRRVVIHPSRRRQLLLLPGAIVVVLVGAWLVRLGDLAKTLAGGTAALFFGLCEVLLARGLLDRRPALVLDADGLHDNASALAAGLIRWSEITRAEVFDYRGQRMLGIDVRDRETLLARVSPAKRPAMRTNARLVGAIVAIPQNILPVGVETVLAEMRQFRGPDGLAW